MRSFHVGNKEEETRVPGIVVLEEMFLLLLLVLCPIRPAGLFL
jgi:hypothetical protein